MTYANIKILPSDSQNTYDLHPFLKPLVEQLALQHPTWTFEGKNYHPRGGDVYHSGKVVITDKREEIGRISLGVYNNKNAFVLSSRRIDDSRERGHDSKTTDIKKAVKIVNKFISRKTILEKVMEAHTNTLNTINSVLQVKGQKEASTYNSIRVPLTALLMASWDRLSPILCLNEEGMNFPNAVAEHKTAVDIYDAFSQGAGYLVFIDGLDYAVNKIGSDERKVLTSDQLPDDIKGKVGMLKLVNDSQIIENVGIKVASDTFFVLA